YRRAFERDKEMLRGMGVPIEVVTLTDGVEKAYRVPHDEYYLPDLGLEPEETAALRVAVGAVVLGGAADGRGALMKLGGLGGEPALTARLVVDASHRDAVVARVGEDAVAERRADGVVVEVVVTNRAAFRSFALEFLDHAEVLDPPELRADVVAWLSAIAGGDA